MKVILEFDKYEEWQELQEALNAGHLAAAIQSLDEALRAMAKYEGKTTIPIDEARKMLRDELEDLPWVLS